MDKCFAYFVDSAAVLADAKNPDNAKLFQNFIMDPENAAMISNFAKYVNGIKRSGEYLSEELKTAPELSVPPELEASGAFLAVCPVEVNDLYARTWTDISK